MELRIPLLVAIFFFIGFSHAAVTRVFPLAVASGVSVQLNLTGATIDSWAAFVPQSANGCEGALYTGAKVTQMNTWQLNQNTPLRYLSPGTYKLCTSSSNPPTNDTEDYNELALTIRVIYPTRVNKTVLLAGSNNDISIDGVVQGDVVALVNDASCAGAYTNKNPVGAGGIIQNIMPNAGRLYLCYSTTPAADEDFSNIHSQVVTFPTMAAVNQTAITSISPLVALVGESQTINVSVSDGRIAFIPTGNGCSGALAASYVVPATGSVAIINSGAGVLTQTGSHVLCYSHAAATSDGDFYVQNGITLKVASVRSFTPKTLLPLTQTSVNIQGTVSDFDVVAIVTSSNNCAGAYAARLTVMTNTFVIPASGAGSISSPGTYYLCYSSSNANSDASFVNVNKIITSFPTVKVVNSTTINGIQPKSRALANVGMTYALNGTFTYSDFAAFLPNGMDCSLANAASTSISSQYGGSVYMNPSGPVSFSSLGLWHACYSSAQKTLSSDFVAQDLSFQVFSITRIRPVAFASDLPTTITFTGAIVGDLVAFSTSASNCNGAASVNYPIITGGIITLPAGSLGPGQYYACYGSSAATSDADFYNLGITLRSINRDGITKTIPSVVMPRFASSFTMKFLGSEVAAGKAAFIASDIAGCSGAYVRAKGVLIGSYSPTLGVDFRSATTFKLCFSSTDAQSDNDFVEMRGITVRALQLQPFSPVTIRTDGARSLEIQGAAPGDYIGLVTSPTSCTGAFSNKSSVSASSTAIVSGLTKGTYYYLCYAGSNPSEDADFQNVYQMTNLANSPKYPRLYAVGYDLIQKLDPPFINSNDPYNKVKVIGNASDGDLVAFTPGGEAVCLGARKAALPIQGGWLYFTAGAVASTYDVGAYQVCLAGKDAQSDDDFVQQFSVDMQVVAILSVYPASVPRSQVSTVKIFGAEANALAAFIPYASNCDGAHGQSRVVDQNGFVEVPSLDTGEYYLCYALPGAEGDSNYMFIRNVVLNVTTMQQRRVGTTACISTNVLTTGITSGTTSTGTTIVGPPVMTTGLLPDEVILEVVVKLNESKHSECQFCDESKYRCSDDEEWNDGVKFLDDPRVGVYEGYSIVAVKLKNILKKNCWDDESEVPAFIVELQSAEIYTSSVPWETDPEENCICNMTCPELKNISTTERDFSGYNYPLGTIFKLQIKNSVKICVASVSMYFVLHKGMPESNTPPEALSSGEKAGIAIGVIAAVGLVAGVAFFVLRKRRKYAFNNNSEDGQISEMRQFDTIPELQNIIIKKKLGNGKFGDVYLGDWEGVNVACKKLKNSEDMISFQKEATTLFNLTHPFVVQFLGKFVDDDGSQYIVVEYMSKGSLKDLLEKKQSELKFRDLVDMAICTCKGMVFLSGKGILHRDLGVRNLLCSFSDGKYVVKISDFGLSRFGDSQAPLIETKSMSPYLRKSAPMDSIYILGSSAPIPVKWSAPEVINDRVFTVKSDVWSFGIVMWEILSFGAQPYGWMQMHEALTEIPKGARLPKPDNCPDELWEIIKSCWQLQPELRPTFPDLLRSLQTFELEVLNSGELKRTGETNKSNADDRYIDPKVIQREEEKIEGLYAGYYNTNSSLLVPPEEEKGGSPKSPKSPKTPKKGKLEVSQDQNYGLTPANAPPSPNTLPREEDAYVDGEGEEKTPQQTYNTEVNIDITVAPKKDKKSKMSKKEKRTERKDKEFDLSDIKMSNETAKEEEEEDA
eukprot:TRINITY_DN2812_c0_g1_i4.p1 TRINITY_DN2812_c0_g1~~TRINITY_DN2812_c0_g1_i4.p1  ORF type:complete len:1716 (+),score=368.48 TRINITY_DN2812_c0_g1_i4:182-5329(+)